MGGQGTGGQGNRTLGRNGTHRAQKGVREGTHKYGNAWEKGTCSATS